jgi:hypothetical protein
MAARRLSPQVWIGDLQQKKKKQQKDSWGQGEDHYGVLMEDWRLFWVIGSWFCYGFFRFLGFFPL